MFNGGRCCDILEGENCRVFLIRLIYENIFENWV